MKGDISTGEQEPWKLIAIYHNCWAWSAKRFHPLYCFKEMCTYHLGTLYYEENSIFQNWLQSLFCNFSRHAEKLFVVEGDEWFDIKMICFHTRK